MEKKVGLWIDDTKAVIFSLADEGAQIKRVSSEVKNNVRSPAVVETGSVPDNGNKAQTGRLDHYYDEVLSHLRDAESILIFGPGDAKLELKKRLENLELDSHIVGFETVEKMTDNHIVAKIRQRFLN